MENEKQTNTLKLAQTLEESFDNLCATLVDAMNNFKAFVNERTEVIKQAKADIIAKNAEMADIARVADAGAYSIDCVAEEFQLLTEDLEETFAESNVGEVTYKLPDDTEEEEDEEKAEN